MKSQQPAILTSHSGRSLKPHIRDVCAELRHKALCFCHSEYAHRSEAALCFQTVLIATEVAIQSIRIHYLMSQSCY
jgi:hypothetical protein